MQQYAFKVSELYLLVPEPLMLFTRCPVLCCKVLDMLTGQILTGSLIPLLPSGKSSPFIAVGITELFCRERCGLSFLFPCFPYAFPSFILPPEYLFPVQVVVFLPPCLLLFVRSCAVYSHAFSFPVFPCNANKTTL